MVRAGGAKWRSGAEDGVPGPAHHACRATLSLGSSEFVRQVAPQEPHIEGRRGGWSLVKHDVLEEIQVVGWEPPTLHGRFRPCGEYIVLACRRSCTACAAVVISEFGC
eukprot:18751-Eustigmatos_ZCMA.PRE.1